MKASRSGFGPYLANPARGSAARPVHGRPVVPGDVDLGHVQWPLVRWLPRGRAVRARFHDAEDQPDMHFAPADE